jgi:oligosaccharide repeat unit polymerase
MALYQQSAGGASSGLGLLSSFFIPGSMFLLIGSKDRSVGRWFGIGVILLNAVVEFFLGSRTNAMWPLLGLIWAYHRSIRALPRTLLVAGAMLVLIVIFPMVKAFRGITGSARTSIDALVGAYVSVDNPLVSIISEMGYSMVTVAHTLQLVPEVRPYDLGAGYFYAATTVIPSVMGDVHPAVARGTAAQWLIENVAPDTARVGGGLGFSFLAEGYYNFGWVGGLIVLFVIGAIMSTFFVRSAYSGTPLGIAISAIALSFLTYYARGESASIIRSLVWYTAIPAAVVVVVASTLKIQSVRDRKAVAIATSSM